LRAFRVPSESKGLHRGPKIGPGRYRCPRGHHPTRMGILSKRSASKGLALSRLFPSSDVTSQSTLTPGRCSSNSNTAETGFAVTPTKQTTAVLSNRNKKPSPRGVTIWLRLAPAFVAAAFPASLWRAPQPSRGGGRFSPAVEYNQDQETAPSCLSNGDEPPIRSIGERWPLHRQPKRGLPRAWRRGFRNRCELCQQLRRDGLG
jgi:hypothetical protein